MRFDKAFVTLSLFFPNSIHGLSGCDDKQHTLRSLPKDKNPLEYASLSSEQPQPQSQSQSQPQPQSILSETLHEIGFSQSLTVTGNPLVERSSQYQNILVYQTPHFGKVLVLDDVVQLTERDGASYNEMMAHIPMMEHPAPKRVLVIGGGDGYVLHEVLKHDSVIQVDHVDLDGDVVEVCKDHFSWGRAWEDPRVTLHIADGAAFVRNAPEDFYDVVIQDSSDPYTVNEEGIPVELPSSVLYSTDHYDNVRRILTKDGIFNFQAETFNLPSDLEGICKWRKKALNVGFESVKYGSLYISSYPTGQIGFLMCQKNDSPSKSSKKDAIQQRFDILESTGKGTKYYQPSLQTSSFDLPLWVSKSIYGDKRKDCVPEPSAMDVTVTTTQTTE